MNKPKPSSLTTKRYKRNLIIAAIVVAAIIATGIALYTIPRNVERSIMSDDKFQPQVTEIQEEAVETINTPEHARTMIREYYTALANNDVAKLRAMDANYAASALELGWLKNIGYQIDKSKLDKPTKDVFPQSQGIYAGCTLYKISDFYDTAPTKAIKSDVTGETGAEGWIYYDSLNVRWCIVDPTIPTAVSAAEIQNVQRTSADSNVVVRMSSPGAYCSPWWAYTQVSVEVNNKSKDDSVECSTAVYDDGMFSVVPSDLLKGIAKSSKKSGICQVYRGTTSNFKIDKIGAIALNIEGNVCPVMLTYGNENISPIFAMGDTTAHDIGELLSEQQLEQFNAKSEGYDYVMNRGTGDSANAQSQPAGANSEQQ